MKRLIFLGLCLFLIGAAPSRDNTYVAGQTIRAADVTANEDAIFNYLQAGVDTYADDTIVNADINSSANIQSDKLNLTSIAQNVKITSSGSFENDGATNLDGNTTIGDAAGDTLTIDAGTWTLTNATTWTLTGALTFSGTIADLGTVTTTGTFGLGDKLTAGANEIEGSNFDINGGTINGLTNLGMTTVTNIDDILDEDAMGSDSATALATQQSIKAYADTKLGPLGAWATGNWNSSTQAATDGFLVVYVGDGSSAIDVEINTDSSNPPTTVRQLVSAQAGEERSMMCPVKSGDYYLVEEVNDSPANPDTRTVYWIPFQ